MAPLAPGRFVKIHRSQLACRQLWRKRKRAIGPASAPKLRQNPKKNIIFQFLPFLQLLFSACSAMLADAAPERFSQVNRGLETI
jgi:hypothetical protein